MSAMLHVRGLEKAQHSSRRNRAGNRADIPGEDPHLQTFEATPTVVLGPIVPDQQLGIDPGNRVVAKRSTHSLFRYPFGFNTVSGAHR